MTQMARIEKGPHVLWKSNREHYGIEVVSLRPIEELRRDGLASRWRVNAMCFCTDSRYQEFLGLTEEQYKDLVNELTELENAAIAAMEDTKKVL